MNQTVDILLRAALAVVLIWLAMYLVYKAEGRKKK